MLPVITTLADTTLRDMLARAQHINVMARQADAADRLLILEGNWREVAQGYIHQLYRTPEWKRGISKRVKRNHNVLATLTDKCCVSYKVPPVRRLKDAAQASQDAYAELLVESSITTRAKSWERYAFALNVAIVVPVVRPDPREGKRLDYETILPHCCEVTTDPTDPMGSPRSIVYAVKDGSDRTGGRNPITHVVLDDEAWWYLDEHGRTVNAIPHGAGVFPGVPFRLVDPIDDWWCSFRGSGAVDATLAVTHLSARLDWIRDFQDHKRELFASETLQAIPIQVAGPEGAMQIPMRAGDFDYKVEDLIVPIDEHAKHIRLHKRAAAESLGVPPVLLDDEAQGPVSDLVAAQQHEALAGIRSAHIDHLTKAESELAWKTALVLRGAGHRLASKLPPDLVAEKFSISFPPLSFVDHPKVRAEVYKAKIDLGLLSTFRAYHEEHPHLTFEQARAEVLQIAEEEAEVNKLYVERNLPRAVDERRNTIAQIQGRDGGDTKALNAATDEEPADDGEAD